MNRMTATLPIAPGATVRRERRGLQQDSPVETRDTTLRTVVAGLRRDMERGASRDRVSRTVKEKDT